jgi:adenylate cyclase
MVVFGSPVIHADDAARAVNSAIAMQIKADQIDQNLAAENGLRLKVGIGIATGTVFSGILGSLRKKEFSSIGMAVNIASRLQGMAGAGEILISEETYSKIKGRLDANSLPPVRVKGIDEPMTVYRVNFQLP